MPARVVPRCFEAAWDPDRSVAPVARGPDQFARHRHHVAIAADDGAMRAHPHCAGAPPCRMVGRSPSWRLRRHVARRRRHGRDPEALADRYTLFADRLGDLLHANGAICTSGFSTRRLACSRATTRIATSRSSMATPMCGTSSCRAMAGSDVRVFDWDAWRIGVASNDLAYMMATHWYPERRRRMERRCSITTMRHSWRTACAATTAARWTTTIAGRCCGRSRHRCGRRRSTSRRVIWWSHLERIMLAVDDLGCRDLLSPMIWRRSSGHRRFPRQYSELDCGPQRRRSSDG